MKYKTPSHVRQFVKKELYDYSFNLKRFDRLNTDTRAFIVTSERLIAIGAVLDTLSEEERKAFDVIFIKKKGHVKAELEDGLGRGAYYNTMNKVIYLTAREMGLI